MAGEGGSSSGTPTHVRESPSTPKPKTPKPATPKATGDGGSGSGVRHDPIPKFGTQTAKGVVIWVYRNGDKHHQGDKYVYHNTKYKNLDQVCIGLEIYA